MERATTPPSNTGPSDTAPPSTPTGATMRVQRNAPVPSTPNHRRRMSTPRTPGANQLTCSSLLDAFTRITVHTAKCSECDLRNKGTMLRCPGCTFQICKPCQDRREKAGRSLAHGTMLSPQVATPGASGSVVRRKPLATVKSVGKGRIEGKDGGEERGAVEKEQAKEKKGKKREAKQKAKPKLKSMPRLEEETPSDDSSDNDFAPDPASPTSNKRRRTELTSKTDDTVEMPSPFLTPADKAKDSTRLGPGGSERTEKPLSEMTIDELLAHHGVNTPENPYQAHLLSRERLVVSNPVMEIPEVVKRGHRPRPTAEEIQKNIQDKVRERTGLPRWPAETDGSE
ncbi:hypothetical protein OPT61_g4956 [Boeremia exigua]|uniref:Uncharacterized protein n=1 Tax=Boeremia exigua TaxID=749465 RepID=A0ACC2IC57_9PLEO|nr:hypothetical protein OPT61_g4956 [Boeremia exigua]